MPSGTHVKNYFRFRRKHLHGIKLLAAVLLFWSCAKHESPIAYDVYACGINDSNQICYWKNGQMVVLTDGKFSAGADRIMVDGSDVFVVGYEYNGNPQTQSAFAVSKVWKNGTAMSQSFDSYTNLYSMTLSHGDLYLAGSDEALNASGVLTNVATYWKNGQAVYLSDGTNDANASSIAVVGNDVYAAGYDNFQAVQWKNGAPTALSPGEPCLANAMSIAGQDVYVAGQKLKQATLSSPITYYAMYWKNGTPTLLTDGSTSLFVSDIAVTDSGDIYVSASEDANGTRQARVWKNSQLVSLQSNNYTNGEGAYAIAVFDRDVLVAGGGGYWKNGSPVRLANCGVVTDIFLNPR